MPIIMKYVLTANHVLSYMIIRFGTKSDLEEESYGKILLEKPYCIAMNEIVRVNESLYTK